MEIHVKVFCLTCMLLAFQALLSSASDDVCKEPFVWVKGCHHQPSSEMIAKEIRTTNNSPGTCFLECGRLTSLVALHLDQCACLRQGSKLKPVYESRCDSRCQGDENMDCGSRNEPVSWTVYQKASDAELKTMLIQSNATGCGYSLNNGASFGLASCSSNKAVLCYSRVGWCLNEVNPIGLHTWKGGHRDCHFENSLYPPSFEILHILLDKCKTVYSQDTYWIGLYRRKEFSDGCEITTAVTDTTKQDTDITSTSDTNITSTSVTTASKDVSTETQIPSEMTTNYRKISEITQTPTGIVSSDNTMKISLTEQKQTRVTTMSETDITSEMLQSPSTKHLKSPSTNNPHLDFQASTELPTSNSHATSTNTADHIVTKGTQASPELKSSKTHTPALLKLATKKPLQALTISTVDNKSSKSRMTKPVSKVSSVLTSITSNPTLAILSRQSPVYGSHLPSTETTSTSESSVGSKGSEISEPIRTMDLSGRVIIALYVVGSCICILLLVIVLILCRISRILQKQADKKNISQPTIKHKERQNFTYLTDGAASLPVRGGLLSGRQSPPYPYNGFHRQHSETDTDQMQIRERMSNIYTDMLTSHRDGDTFRVLSEDGYCRSGTHSRKDIGNIV